MLVRTAHHSDLLEIELTARGIPYVKYGGLRFTEAAHVKDFIAAARIVANPADDLAWFRLLRLHEGDRPGAGPAGDRGVAHRRAAAVRALAGRGVRPAAALRPGRQRHRRPACAGSRTEQTAGGVEVILAALRDPLQHAIADAAVRLADLERLATRPRPARRCTRRWCSSRWTRRCRHLTWPASRGWTRTSW